MTEPCCLAAEFEHWRPHLSSVAYSMLGSVSDAEDAVQLAWLRLHRSDARPAWCWSMARPGCCSAPGTR